MTHLLIFLLSIFTSERHDFHVSITNAELNPQTNSLQVSMKLFTEDLEAALADDYSLKPNLSEPDEHPKVDSLIYELITKNFDIGNALQELDFEYIGKEHEQDITFVYLEALDMAPVNELRVRNTIFFDRFDDQSNIVNIEVRDEVKSAFLENSKPQATLTFD